jgi:secreted PhoX family phosphatase
VSRNLHLPGSCNPSANPAFEEVVLSRRGFLQAGLGAAAVAALPSCATPGTKPLISFTPIAPSSEDLLRVPPEYEAKVLYRWGDPVGVAAGMPEFRMDASGSAADQALQAGMHHDGMHYFPLSGSTHGLLAMNHEYMDEGLLFPDGMRTWSAEKVAKAQNAVGVSVIEVAFTNNAWRVVRPSKNARRITAATPCRISGPAGGHPLMRTASNPDGRMVLGTYSGCAHGWTPWGTYLSCEENWQLQFVNASGSIPADQQRYRITTRGIGARWEHYDARFDAARHPNEPNRFGWVVEIDPYDPQSIPVKRTALGRFTHEGAACSIGADRRLAFYMGDDQPSEYIYKFVPSGRFMPDNREANRDLLDEGTLYAARFNADGTGDWLPLTGSDPGAVVVRTRQAADAAGATPMDRPEWIVPHPVTREVYASLSAGPGRTQAAPGNPRAPNPYGHVLRWREEGDDVASRRFRWEVFVLAGPEGSNATIRGDAFACPDGLWIDSMGTLWVQTDVSPSVLGRREFAPLGNNQMLAVDPATGVFRRFLTGPRGCEITGFHTTPDNRTAFVNIQHPGEAPGDRSNPDNPRAFSNWPDYAPDGRPRSATVAIRRRDGGVIGT